MTTGQKLSIRLSEIRQRLNEIAGFEADAVTDEIRTEADQLTGEFRVAETQHRAATIAEADEQAAAEGEFGNNGDGEPAEIRVMLDRIHIADYLTPAAGGAGLSGAPVEIASALKLPVTGASGGVAVPWQVLGRGIERRAFTTTGNNDGPEIQRPILQRLFGPGVFDQLGVRVDSVPVGRVEWPLVATGVAPVQVAEASAAAAAAAAVATTFTYANLRPKRLSGITEYTHELSASVAAAEQTLRRDIADAAQSAMSNSLVNGAAVDPNDAATAANVEGFISALAAPTAPSAEATYGAYAGSHAALVDGLHAEMEMQISSLVGTDVYHHAAAVYQAGSGESGSEALSRRSMSCMASAYVPAADSTSHISNGNIYHASGPNGGGVLRGDTVAAIWPTLELIRDPYSVASTGVRLTWIVLWDARVALREAAYSRVAFQLA